MGQEVSNATSRYRLRNGLTVLVRQRHTAPLIGIRVAIRAGWAEEPEGQTGVARVTQEVIWQQMARRSKVPVEQMVARLGGQWRTEVSAFAATTTLVVPAESYAEAITFLAESLQLQTIEPAAVDTAVRLLGLEDLASRRQPDLLRMERFLSLGLPGSAWARGGPLRQTAGEVVTSEMVERFHRQHYQPARMVIAVTGDTFSLPALEQVQLRFGSFGGRAAPPPPPPSPPSTAPAPAANGGTGAMGEKSPEPAALLRYGNDLAPLRQTRVTIGYRLPLPEPALPAEAAEKEEAILEMLAAVLGRGRASRLWQGLREGAASRDRQSVAIEARFDYLPSPLIVRAGGGAREVETGWGLLVARLTVDPNRVDRAEAEYFREIERFRRESISPAELERARTLLEKADVDALETLEADAALLADGQLLDGDYRRRERRSALRRTVTVQEIQQAAAKYLVLSRAIVHELEPEGAAPRTFTAERFTDLVTTLAPAAGRPVQPEEVKPAVVLKQFPQGPARVAGPGGQNVLVAPIPLPVRDFSVLRGPRAFVREDKSQPKITAAVLFQGGRLLETPTSSGITELMLRTMLKSSVTRKADLIAHELESYGAEVAIINQPDFYGYAIEVLSRNAEPAIKLLIEIVEKPFFDREELVREQGVLLGDQLRWQEDAEGQARELLWMSLFPGHPYGLPTFGLAEVVRGVTVEKLEEWHQQTIRRQYPMVVLVGDTDGSAIVSRIFSDGLRRGDLDRTLRVNLPTTSAASGDRVLPAPGEAVTRQALGFRVFSSALPGPQDAQVLALLARWVSNGPLLGAFRDPAGPVGLLAGSFEPRLAAGGFVAQLTTAPENETRALDLLNRELQRLVAAPPTDDEFEYARNSAIGQYAIALQSPRERILEYARALFFGRQPTDVERQAEAVVAIRKADLQRVAEAIFRTNLSGRGLLRGTANPTQPPAPPPGKP
jgi:zinc protease